jgi:hypothetical protein
MTADRVDGDILPPCFPLLVVSVIVAVYPTAAVDLTNPCILYCSDE